MLIESQVRPGILISYVCIVNDKGFQTSPVSKNANTNANRLEPCERGQTAAAPIILQGDNPPRPRARRDHLRGIKPSLPLHSELHDQCGKRRASDLL